MASHFVTQTCFIEIFQDDHVRLHVVTHNSYNYLLLHADTKFARVIILTLGSYPPKGVLITGVQHFGKQLYSQAAAGAQQLGPALAQPNLIH